MSYRFLCSNSKSMSWRRTSLFLFFGACIDQDLDENSSAMTTGGSDDQRESTDSASFSIPSLELSDGVITAGNSLDIEDGLSSSCSALGEEGRSQPSEDPGLKDDGELEAAGDAVNFQVLISWCHLKLFFLVFSLKIQTFVHLSSVCFCDCSSPPDHRGSCNSCCCSQYCCCLGGPRTCTLHAGILPGEVDHLEGEEDPHHHAERERALPPAGHYEHTLPALEGKLRLILFINNFMYIDNKIIVACKIALE